MPKPDSKPVPTNNAAVSQHKRMAMGEKAVGQKLPAAPANPARINKPAAK